MKRALIGTACALLLATSLSACGDGRKCLSHHTEMQYVPRPVSHFNGKTTTTTMQYGFHPVSVCDRYEETYR